MQAILPAWLLLFEADLEDEQHASIDQDELTQTEKELVCGSCQAPITRNEARISINDGHEHRFFNPHGIIYRIGCFSEAGGCRPASAPSEVFSWFPGYDWRITCCFRCHTHLGWDFSKDGLTAFYGLILDRLCEG